MFEDKLTVVIQREFDDRQEYADREYENDEAYIYVWGDICQDYERPDCPGESKNRQVYNRKDFAGYRNSDFLLQVRIRLSGIIKRQLGCKVEKFSLREIDSALHLIK